MYSMETLNMRVLNRRPLEVPPCYSLPPTHGSSFKSVWLSEFEHFKINTDHVASLVSQESSWCLCQIAKWALTLLCGPWDPHSWIWHYSRIYLLVSWSFRNIILSLKPIKVTSDFILSFEKSYRGRHHSKISKTKTMISSLWMRPRGVSGESKNPADQSTPWWVWALILSSNWIKFQQQKTWIFDIFFSVLTFFCSLFNLG